ncbi:hypothetical protein ACA910_019030 [Epithemia clementina (nom. ined.)]
MTYPESVRTGIELRQWRDRLMNYMEKYLSGDCASLAQWKYKAFSDNVGELLQKLYQLRCCFLKQDQEAERQDNHSTNEDHCTVSVQTSRTIANVQESTRRLTDDLQALVPATLQEESDCGFTKFHMGSVLVRNHFDEYDRLHMCKHYFDCFLRRELVTIAGGKQLLSEMERFSKQIDSFCAIMKDLKLFENMEKYRALRRRSVSSPSSSRVGHRDENRGRCRSRRSVSSPSPVRRHHSKGNNGENRFSSPSSSQVRHRHSQRHREEYMENCRFCTSLSSSSFPVCRRQHSQGQREEFVKTYHAHESVSSPSLCPLRQQHSKGHIEALTLHLESPRRASKFRSSSVESEQKHPPAQKKPERRSSTSCSDDRSSLVDFEKKEKTETSLALAEVEKAIETKSNCLSTKSMGFSETTSYKHDHSGLTPLVTNYSPAPNVSIANIRNRVYCSPQHGTSAKVKVDQFYSEAKSPTQSSRQRETVSPPAVQKKSNQDHDELSRTFFFLPWDCLNHKKIKRSVLVPFDRSKNILYISHNDSVLESSTFKLIKKERTNYSKDYDGFFYDLCCTCWGPSLSKVKDKAKRHRLYSLFLKHCYVLVINPIEVRRTPFKVLWECMFASKHDKLIINDNVFPFIMNISGPNPTFDTVERILEQRANSCDSADVKELLHHLRALYLEKAAYALIPAHDLIRATTWDDVTTVPLDDKQVDKSRILMISHRWKTEQHPDPESTKLRKIQNFIRNHANGWYTHIFFDYKCIHVFESNKAEFLVKINELYAQSPCFCIFDDDYFDRSWCLLELSVSVFGDGTTIIQRNKGPEHAIFAWLKRARVLQHCGFLHSCATTFQVGEITLRLPTDALDLKTQLHALIKKSQVTNPSDKRKILCLLDSLIKTPMK